MRKVILFVLMALMLVIPAYAAEGDAATNQPIQQEQEPVVVASLDELQAAINVAEDGDTIYLAAAIGVSGATIETDKKLTIASSNEHNSELLRLYDGAIVRGFCFSETDFSGNSFFVINDATTDGVIVENCDFEYYGEDSVDFIRIYGNLETNKAYIKQCTFNGATHGAMSMMAYTDVEIDSCIFSRNQNYMSGGAISSSGKICVKNSIFTDNFAGSAGGILCTNNLTIENCQFSNNSISQGGMGRDIFSTEKVSIMSKSNDSHNFYNEITGEKINLPLVDYEGTMRLILLTEEQATEYFESEPPKEEPEQPAPGNGEDAPPEQPQPPQQPGDQTGDDDTTGGEQPPQGPAQPPEGEGTDNPDNPDSGDQNAPQEPVQPPQDGNEDDPTDTPPQTPQEPTQPPKDDTPDNPTDTTPDTPQPPQKPSDGNSGNDDDYTPPVDFKPSQRPTRPSVTVKPTENDKPQTKPDTPAPAKPQLACNGALIDTSRTVVLLGYEDGLLHEGEPLTRAQLATIVFRLLDDASIVKYSNAQVAFTDVAADAWYAPYVRVIQAAGIVNGVGDGKYDPDGTVTWSQIIAILSRFVEPQDYTLQHIQYNGWAEQAIQTAVARGWIEDRADFIPNAIISRGQLEQLINGVLALYH